MIRAITALLASLTLLGCAPAFHMQDPSAAPTAVQAARLKIDDGAATPAYPVAGPFARWLPVQRDAARQLHEAIVSGLGRRIRTRGGSGTLVVHLTYVNVSIHKGVVDYPPFIAPDDDTAAHPVRTTVLGTLTLEDAQGKPRRTAPVDIHELVMHRLNGDDAVRASVNQAARLAIADLYRAVDRLSAPRPR